MIEDSKDKLAKAEIKPFEVNTGELGGLMFLVGPMARSIF